MLLDAIIMIYNILWGFSIDLSYFGYNSAGQKNPVLRIFAFQGPSRTQIDTGFWGVNILPREAPGAQEVNERSPRAQKRPGGAGLQPDHVILSCLRLGPPIPSIFVSRCLS
jgi:hypothetical protein